MDLHVVGPAATPEERAAIDAVLDPVIGAPRSGWAGGARDPAVDGHVAHGGHEARERRDLLLPALEAAAGRDRLGQPRRPQPRLEAARGPAGRGLRRRVVLRAAPDDAAAADRGPRVRRHRLPARGRGADLRGPGAPARAGRLGDRGRRATWMRSPCLGQCERAPAVMVTSAGAQPTAHVGATSTAATTCSRCWRRPACPRTSNVDVGRCPATSRHRRATRRCAC